MPVFNFVRLLDESPFSQLFVFARLLDEAPLPGVTINAAPLQATGALAGNTQIDIMAYVDPLIAISELRGNWAPGDATSIDAGALQATTQLKGSFSSGDSENDPLQAVGALRGKVRITPAARIPQVRAEIRDADGALVYLLSRAVESWQWGTEPEAGGCKAATVLIQGTAPKTTILTGFAAIFDEGAITIGSGSTTTHIDETVIGGYDLRIVVNTGSGFVPWWRGYVANPRLVLDGDRWQMSISALGWSQRLKSIPIVGLGFDIEDGGVRFQEQDAAAIVRTLVDRANAAGAGLTYDRVIVPDSGYEISNIQFNSSVFDAITELAALAGEAVWGVNRFKEFYFLAPSSATDRTFFVSRDVESLSHDLDYEQMINRLYLFGAGGRKWLIEDTATLAADVSSATGSSTTSFGKAMANQKLAQEFTTTRKTISAIDLKLSRTGWGANLITDGDMELDDGSTPVNWGKVWNRSRRKKTSANSHAGTRCLEVYHNQSGNGRYGVFHDVTVTPDQPLSFWAWVIDPESEDPVTIDILDGQTGDAPAKNSDPIIFSVRGANTDLSWHRLSGSFTPENNSVGIRIWSNNRKGGTKSDPFFVDDVSLMAASDVVVSIVERTSTTPRRYDEENPLATVTLPFEQVAAGATVVRLILNASPLDPSKTYAILVSIEGELNGSSYFDLTYDNTGSGLYRYDGIVWQAVSGSAYHVTYLPSAQITYGVRAETLYRPTIDNDTDAALYGASYLANRGSPVARGSAVLVPNTNALIEDTEPVPLVRVVGTKDGRTVDFSLRPKVVDYSLSPRGLECSLDLGRALPRISGALRYMEYLLSLRE